MSKNAYFKRTIQAVLMPAFVWGTQIFFRFLFDLPPAGIGVSFAAIALSQIFPYIFYDNFILLKIYSLKSEMELKNHQYTETSAFKIINDDPKRVIFFKYLTIFIFLLILFLFVMTLGLVNKPEFAYIHNFTGGTALALSILYLIFV